MRVNFDSLRVGGIGGRVQRSSVPRLAPYLFLLPQTMLVLVFIIRPLKQTAWLSLNDWVLSLRPAPTFDGLANFEGLFADPLFQQALKTTVLYVLGTTPIALSLGLLVAIALNQPIGKLRVLFRTAFFVPVVVPTVVVALVWVFLFELRVGLVNNVISSRGIAPPNWGADVHFALVTVIIASVWQQIGFAMVIFLAGLQAIPGTFYEAGAVDGANSLQRFRYITLPMLAPTTIFALITSIISGFKVFDQVFVMTGGGPANSTVTLVYYLYIQAFEFFDVGRGTAAAMTLLLILAILTAIILRFGNRGDNDDS
jgi:multiple sugar transport system permease protein